MTPKWAKPFAENDYRRTVAIAWAGWATTIGLTGLRAFDVIPPNISTLSFLTVGIAIAASLALSRMRLAKTVSQVFTVGLQSATPLSANIFTDTCIMMLDRDGEVGSVDRADAIGWTEEALVGRKLSDMLAPRSRGQRTIRAGASITSPMLNGKGEAFDARLRFAALHTEAYGGEGLIVTVSPVIAINAEGNYAK